MKAGFHPLGRTFGSAPGKVTSTAFDALLRELEAMEGELTKPRVRALLARYGGQRLYIPATPARIAQRVALADKLLTQGIERHAIAQRLQTAFSVSQSTAYADIQRAIVWRR